MEDLLADQRERWQKGDRVWVEAYLETRPGLRDDRTLVLRLLRQEVALRGQAGEVPRPDEYVRRFPELANELHGLFDGGPAAEPAPAATGTDPLGLPPIPPRVAWSEPPPPQVPGYEVLGKLGQGGMGVVYQARHLRLKCLVALKMIRADTLAGPDDVDRFRREAETVAHLRHAHVVHIYEVGEHHGLPYFALEYLEGGSLAGQLGGKPQPARAAAGLVETLARAMHAAHQKGIVHRDLKPANVLLAADGTPKVTDFGLAKRLEAPSGLTPTGAVLGTPSYMAPEQARGRGKEVGPAADTYALGAILYECLTGRPPFLADTWEEAMRQVLWAEPVPPARLRPQLPRDLDTICLKCLEKEPARRYASAAALADDLRRFLDGKPIVARPLSAVGRLARWCRRSPVVAGLAAALAAVAVTAFVLVTANMLEARRERNDKEAARLDALDRKEAAERAEWLANDRTFQAEYNLSLSLFEAARAAWSDHDVARAEKLLDDIAPRLRGFEWHFLKRLCRGQRHVWPCHNDTVDLLAFSPDGSRLAAASGETVKLLDARTGAVEQTLRHGDRRVTALAFRPDGKHLVTAGGGVLRIWEADTGKEVRAIDQKGYVTFAVAFQKDGKEVLAANAQDVALLDAAVELRAWEADTGKPLRTTPVAAGACPQPRGTLSANGKWCAWTTSGPNYKQDYRVWVCETETGKVVGTLRGHSEWVTRLAFSPNSVYLASAAWDQTVRVWLVGEAGPSLALREHTAQPLAAAFSPDSRLLTTAGHDRGILLYDLWNPRYLSPLRGHTRAVSALAFSPDGTRLAAGDLGGEVSLWDLDAPDVRSWRDPDVASAAVALSPDGAVLYSAHYDKGVRVRDLAGGGAPRQLPGHYHTLALSADGARLAAAGNEGLRVWKAPAGEELYHDPELTGPLAFHPDGRRLVCVRKDKRTVVVLDVEAKKEICRLAEPVEEVRAVAVRPDGKELATGGKGPEVAFWDADTGRKLRSVNTGYDEDVRCLAFSPDGRRLAVSGHKGKEFTVQIRDAGSGEMRLTLGGHNDYVSCVAYSPDGRRLVTGSLDRTVRLWDAVTGQPLVHLNRFNRLGHRGPKAAAEDPVPVDHLAFSADGTRLAGCGWLASLTGEVLLWDARPPD